MENCPCGKELSYNDCCKKFHEGEKPKTAEALMRARYSAFAKAKIDFIKNTHIPGTTDFNEKEAQEWAVNSDWLGLEIVKTQNGEEEDNKGVVEFIAKYKNKEAQKELIHHEIASFKKVDNIWYYSDGQIVGMGPIRRTEPKIGRNDPCSCGSGKKYKKCCGA